MDPIIESEPSPEGAPAFRRLGVYRGLLRELGTVAFNVALWPVGLVDEATRVGISRLRRKPASEDPPRLRVVPTPDAAEVPIVLIHGYFHNRSGFLLMGRALRRQGFRNVSIFSYNPLRKDIPALAEGLKRKVEACARECSSPKVHLIGHSLGGLIARYYVEQLGGHRRVHSIVSLGTPHHGTVMAFGSRAPTARQMRPGSEFMNLMAEGLMTDGVRYLSYYSNLDALVVPAQSAVLPNGEGSNVRNILVHDHGHLSLLINQELIDDIAENLSELT